MTAFSMGPALLFCPADRPERYEKALERSDAVIIDLEDAVRPEERGRARAALTASALDPSRVVVRVNPIDSDDGAADLDAVARTAYRTVMVAKTESAERIAALPHELAVIALCETARGVVESERIAGLDNVVALMWGAEDLVASLGGSSSRTPDGGYRDVARAARSRVLIAAGAFGKAAIDTVHLDMADHDGLAREAEDAAAVGFAATACIHPDQVAVIRRAYRPALALVEWARAVLVVADRHEGVFAFDGQMVDEPVLRHARAVLARALHDHGGD